METTFADNHIIRIGVSGPVLPQGAKGRLGHANLRVTVVLLCQQNVEAATLRCFESGFEVRGMTPFAAAVIQRVLIAGV